MEKISKSNQASKAKQINIKLVDTSQILGTSQRNLNFVRIKQKFNSRKILQKFFFLNVSNKPEVLSFIWYNQWNNLHLHYKSLLIYNLLKKIFITRNLYINNFYLNINDNSLSIICQNLSFFRPFRLQQRIKKLQRIYKIRNYAKTLNFNFNSLKKYKLNKINNKINRPKFYRLNSINFKKSKKNKINKLNSRKKPFFSIGKLFIELNKVNFFKFTIFNFLLPKKFLYEKGIRIHKNYIKERFFWESMQLIYGLFNGYVSANLFIHFIYDHTRKNPRRVAFLAYVKRILDFHFQTILKPKIQGIRIEVKGRFNPKSRGKKRIISVGRVKMHENSSNVSYIRTQAITKFGSLGIKIWLCPLL